MTVRLRLLRGAAAADDAPCAVTIGNFDGVHRGHQAMLALLVNEARHRGLQSCVLTFEPHPRDYFAARAAAAAQATRGTSPSAAGSAAPPPAEATPAPAAAPPPGGALPAAPPRIATLRDKVGELRRCGIDRIVVARFDARFAAQSPQAFIDDVLLGALRARYVLVGDDFRFGARRAGTYAMLDEAGTRAGFDVARMMSYEVHGARVSSSAVREALAAGRMDDAAALLGRPYTVSGRACHGAKLGRRLGFPTLNLRLRHAHPAAMGIFVARVRGLPGAPLPAVASLGRRPTVDDSGRILLEVHCLLWPPAFGSDGGYGRCVSVELLHKLHDERHYASLDALREGIAADTAAAHDWWRRHGA